jgi:scyllo-inositol 2-dehydrogenase (NADP+)
MAGDTLRTGLVGYGASQQHGRRHGTYMRAAGLELAAVCDLDPNQLSAARDDFPGVGTFSELDAMLAREIDLVAIVTPNHTHPSLAMRCLEAGKHVVVDKPFCFTVAEADAMIELARRRGVMLSVFYNRRRDGNYLTIQRLVGEGAIGQVYEARFASASGRPHPVPWRNEKASSGGLLYYAYGPHAVDWILKLVPGRVEGVDAYYYSRRPGTGANEDHVRVLMRFQNGAIGDISISRLDLGPQPFWQIAGTEGTIVDSARGVLDGYGPPFPPIAPASGSLTLIQRRDGQPHRREVSYADSSWGSYYADVAAHLLRGGPPPVSLDDARRSTAVMEAAERSAASRKTEPVRDE